jgi:outer membrane receptor for ferrienterochelin and colicins
MPFIARSQSSQTDSLPSNELDEVVVTATRNERKLSNVAVPVRIISQKAIQQSGALRLNAILQEQTGLFITNDFGSGLQIQGLAPDYVLILVDGEPLVGRNAGVLDLNRVTVNNIKKIEIVKGPSSGLYGSEAMGGVVNIITQNATQNTLNAGFRYGRFNSTDANIAAAYRYRKFSLSAFANRNSSYGYDFDKTDLGQTAQSYQNYTGQVKLQQEINRVLKLGLSVRYFYEKQSDLYAAGADTAYGHPNIKEYNVNPFLRWQISAKIRTALRGYLSQFQADTRDYLKRNDSLYYNDFFQQRFQRIESQTDIAITDRNDLSAGGGYTRERLNTNRYSGIRTNTISYVFLQDEQRFGRFTAVAGFRYDNNAAYASRWSPKLALQFKASEKLLINASYGAGFKAPDFRQLYLNFTNNLAGGYTVYGANEISVEQLEQQKQQGIIADISPFGYQLKRLQPEYSTGLNLGASYQFNSRLLGKINFFRNDIDNLIITKIIATKPSNAPIYSYFNINSAYTQGVEAEISYQLSKPFHVEAGYQFLLTADKEMLKQIKAGQVYGKRPSSLVSEQVSRKDYGGLSGRSRHMANLKVFYEHRHWFATLRAIYRSRWGVTDKDGNLILNRDDEYAKGFVQLNSSAGWSFNNGIRLQAGIDNLLNCRDKTWLANQPGITYYLGVSYSFINHKNHKQ